MTSAHVDPVLVVLVALAGLGALTAFRSGARSAYKIARDTQHVTGWAATWAGPWAPP